MLESKIESRVTEYAEKYGWSSLKLQGGGGKGKPDRLYFRGLPPEVLFIEFKQSGEKPRKLQNWWRNRLLKMGFEHHVIDSVNQGKRRFDEQERKKNTNTFWSYDRSSGKRPFWRIGSDNKGQDADGVGSGGLAEADEGSEDIQDPPR